MTDHESRAVAAEIEIEIEATPPFDFAKSLRFVTRFSPAAGEQTIVGDTLTKAFEIDGRAIVARIRSLGTTERPRLGVRLFAPDERFDPETIAATRERIAHYLSLDDDLEPFYDMARDDPVMAPLVAVAYGFHQVRFPTAFENAVWAILGQRSPQPIARRAKDRITDRFGVALQVEGEAYRAFPAATTIARAEDAALADAVGNARKLPYVRAVARAFAATDERRLARDPYDAVRDWLLEIEGIGPWSAAFVLTRGIGRSDGIEPVAPMRAAAAAAYGFPSLDEREFEALASRYGTARGHWAFYLRAVGEFETLGRVRGAG